MRVIRTETYFEPLTPHPWPFQAGNTQFRQWRHPGISFAWMASGTEVAFDYRLFEEFRVFRTGGDELVEQFLQLALVGLTDEINPADLFGYLPIPAGDQILGPIIRDLINLNIVVEHSPALDVSFLSLLKGKTAEVAIRSWIGYMAAPGPLFLLVTVPAGILLVGTAIGLSSIMVGGLPQYTEKRFLTISPNRSRTRK